MVYLISGTAALLVIFLISFFTEKRRLVNGLWFNLLILSLGLTVAFWSVGLAETNNLARLLLILVALFLAFILFFGVYFIIFMLFWNARVVARKEGRSKANLLTLFLGIGLTFIFIIYPFLQIQSLLPTSISVFISIFPVLMAYYFFCFLNFASASFLYQFNHPKPNQDYIIILGSGLINGEVVPPLLASRIERAITFYQKQAQVATPPKLVFSGGQGPDEKLPESIAMQNYAIEQGIPVEQTLVETKSRNTLENMRFSKLIMDTLSPDGFRCLFTTNNYHLFRASLYARQAQLKAVGLGSKTAIYFLPNALIREFIAIVVLKKKRHLIISGLIVLVGLALALVQQFSV